MTKPSAELPPEHLARLPLRAIIALLARNARRVQPLFARGPAEDADPENLQAIEEAIRSAEDFANGAARVADDGTAAFAVAMQCSDQNSPVAFAAALAACSADHAAGIGVFPEAEGEALATAVEALGYFTDALPEGIDCGPAWADFTALLARGEPSFPELGTPIDPSDTGVLGPLWPSAQAPDWYRPGAPGP
jgi:hypothetical protein